MFSRKDKVKVLIEIDTKEYLDKRFKDSFIRYAIEDEVKRRVIKFLEVEIDESVKDMVAEITAEDLDVKEMLRTHYKDKLKSWFDNGSY